MDTDKKPFSSVGRTILAFGCAVLILAVAGAGIAWAVGGGRDKRIDRNEAMEYALADAGVKLSDVTLVRQNLVKEEGYYEIAFSSESHKYQYEIDAFTGKVNGVTIEALSGQTAAAGNGERGGTAGGRQGESAGEGQSGSPGQSADSAGDSETGNQKQPEGAAGEGQSGNDQGAGGESPQNVSGEGAENSQIDLDAARKTALADAGVEDTDVTFKKAELDWDDGRQVYDIEFYTADAEYDYEIDCASGMVLDRKVEWFRGQASGGAGSAGNTDSDISLDEAKRIAAEHAGYSAEEVVFTKEEMETGHGRTEYEIEFRIDRMEYEYTIDAVTGSILEFDSEYED